MPITTLAVLVACASGLLPALLAPKGKGRPFGTNAKHLNRPELVAVCLLLAAVLAGAVAQREDERSLTGREYSHRQIPSGLPPLAFASGGADRMEHPLKPLSWEASVAYYVDRLSPLWPYIQRIHSQYPQVVKYNLTGDFIPRRNDPGEEAAWNYLMHPHVDVAVLSPEQLEREGDKEISSMHDLPLRLTAYNNDTDGGVTRSGDLKFSSQILLFHKEKTEFYWIRQHFVMDDPETVHSVGVISPVDIGDFVVLADSPKNPLSIIQTISFIFPTSHADLVLTMKHVKHADTADGSNRAMAVLHADMVRNALYLPQAQ